MATGCPPNSTATPAAGCCGPSARTTGAMARVRRSRHLLRWPRPSRASSRSAWALRPRSTSSRAPSLMPRVRVVEISNDDAWMRDVGPTFVVNAAGRRRAVDWHFNAWGGLSGGLYFPWDQDELVAQKVAAIEGVDRYRAPLVMEGGAIHTDGQGTLLVTEQCLLNPNRNPDLSKEQIERHLRDYTGASSHHLAGAGRGGRRDRRPHRQPGLLRAARRGVPHVHREQARSAVGGVQRCAGAIACRARCARPPPEGAQACLHRVH